MNILGILIILTGPLLAVAWVIAEFKAQRKWRIVLGLLSLITLASLASLTTFIVNQFNYNAWYGYAAKELIDETIIGIELGRSSDVLAELKRFQSEYHPTYENRARFVPLVTATVERMKKRNPNNSDSAVANAHAKSIITSPDKTMSVEYESLWDDPDGLNSTHTAKLFRNNTLIWSFSAKGRAIEFIWSPTSRYLLFGLTLEDRGMALYFLDAKEKVPMERDLALGKIELQVGDSLPERKSGSFGGLSRVDFDKISWPKPYRCNLHYVYRVDRWAGDADLSLDFKTKPVRLKIEKIVPLPEE